jgi:hypothetical protein
MPSMVALLGSLPIRKCLSIACISMIESSTRRPIDRRSPISVELSSVIPIGIRARTAIDSEIGIVIIDINVARHSPRKSKTAIPVSKMAVHKLESKMEAASQ